MDSVIVAAIVGGIIAVIGSILGTIITLRVQRRRKIIEYQISTMPLLRFKPATDHSLTVTVDKSLITGDTNDKGNSFQVKNAYGFQIHVINGGNIDIEQPINIEIRLDKAAKILEFETQPSSKPDYEIKANRDIKELHVLRLTIPYMNVKQSVVIRLISSDNESGECKVEARGIGIQLLSATRLTKHAPLLVLGGCLLILGALLITIINGNVGSLPGWAISLIGGHTVNKLTVTYPWWDNAIPIALTIFGFILIIFALPAQTTLTGEWESTNKPTSASF